MRGRGSIDKKKKKKKTAYLRHGTEASCIQECAFIMQLLPHMNCSPRGQVPQLDVTIFCSAEQQVGSWNAHKLLHATCMADEHGMQKQRNQSEVLTQNRPSST